MAWSVEFTLSYPGIVGGARTGTHHRELQTTNFKHRAGAREEAAQVVREATEGSAGSPPQVVSKKLVWTEEF